MSCRSLDIRGLRVELADGSRTIIRDADLTVPAGASVAVVGESGAGKSMTTRAIMGLLPDGVVKTAGEIWKGDTRQDTLPEPARRLVRATGIGIVMQNPMSAFDPIFTVESHFRETIAAAGHRLSRREQESRAVQAMEEAGLPEARALYRAYPFQLSGGMLQRVMVALALVNEPEFLIADEPTTDLDLLSQKRVIDLLRERVVSRHVGLLLITHDLAVAAALADTTAIMRDGSIIESGPTRAVLSSPRHPYARELVQAHRALYGRRFHAMLAGVGEGRL